MKTAVKITGGAELVAMLQTLPTKVRRGTLYDLLRVAGEPMRARMGELAPRRPPEPDLADHIVMSPAVKIGRIEGGRGRARTETEAAIAVGPSGQFFYGIFLEYGTVHMSAQPFMRPAFDATQDEVLARLWMGMWDVIQAAATDAPKGRA
jgi:HK97 gp10 family phage protein